LNVGKEFRKKIVSQLGESGNDQTYSSNA